MKKIMFVLLSLLLALSIIAWKFKEGGDKANGTIVYKLKAKTFTGNLKYVYLFEAKDQFNPSETFRKLVFSGKDLTDKIKSCKDLSCLEGNLGEGFSLDLVKGSRYNYWIVLNGQMVQYSGSCHPESLITTVNSSSRISGTFQQDDSAAGGPVIKVSFDATLSKKF
ncbi:hypothetical protein SAMN04515674_102362 [Pseudarcicella hirudinis]|uniref:Uncharacterized protein n=1 Tax=Pseudarcicella hirudinis TaxID=1079859 RepID=A0A1I5PAG3_9BACT|nr:hypothetical protein [Pseudarcicella hirudinis]SFP30907.1 hypothetical protein SAMN04515674_102362 [Pseudarcicella hirudinis]